MPVLSAIVSHLTAAASRLRAIADAEQVCLCVIACVVALYVFVFSSLLYDCVLTWLVIVVLCWSYDVLVLFAFA